MFDLLLKRGTVLDPGREVEGVLDVAIAGGRIAALAPDIPGSESDRVVDVSGKLVVPGLVDLHAHIYWGATWGGAEVDEVCLRHGVTTVVDAGSCGSDNFAGFKRWVADVSRARTYCFVNLSSIGLIASRRVGELANPAYADPQGAAEILRGHPDLAVGLKFRAAQSAVGGPCLPLLKTCRQVADEVRVPVMVHIGDSVETLGEILDWLKGGDIVAHCMTGRRNGPLDADGRVLPEVRRARERGVLFDAAHGRSHFSFDTAERMLEQGFPPDAISTDLSRFGAAGPVYDLPTTMTKFLALGMPLAEVVRLATHRPAEMLGKADQFGTLKVGLPADVAVLQLEDGEFPLKDARGQTRMAHRRLAPYLTVRGGEIV